MTPPVLAVSQASSWAWSLEEDLAFYESEGVRQVGLTMRKLDGLRLADLDALKVRLDDLGIEVVSLLTVGPMSLHEPDRWATQRDELGRFMDAAIALRPQVGVLTTGPAGPLPWEAAADAFHHAMEGTIVEASREDLFLCLEPTNPLRTDVSFVHTLRDAVDLGWRCDLGVCLDVQWCWGERNLAGLVHANLVAIGLVQVSDGRFGSRITPDRLVPGDGDLPWEAVLRLLTDAGYAGPFELEILGPAVDDEGYGDAIRRGLDRVGSVLDSAAEAASRDAADGGGEAAPDSASPPLASN